MSLTLSRRQRTPVAKAPRIRLISFQLGSDLYALPLEKVQRVLDEFTTQGDQSTGRSLVRFQDQTITLIDPGQSFHSSQDPDPRRYLIVCSVGSESLGIPVPSMPRVIGVSEPQFQPLPDLYAHKGSLAYISRLISFDDRQIFYLDLDSPAS